MKLPFNLITQVFNAEEVRHKKYLETCQTYYRNQVQLI